MDRNAGTDSTLRIRNLPNGTELETLRGHGASVEQVVFRPESTDPFTACGDGTVRRVRCEVFGAVRVTADSRVTRSLTAEERATYLGEAA